jgi:hypothetical protein
MFHYFKIPYFTCNVFTKFTYNEYIGPYFLSHVVLQFSPSDLPECGSIYRIWILSFEIRSQKTVTDPVSQPEACSVGERDPEQLVSAEIFGCDQWRTIPSVSIRSPSGSHLSIILSLLVLGAFSKPLEAIGLGFPAKS